MDEASQSRMTNNAEKDTSTPKVKEVVLVWCFYYNSTGQKVAHNTTKVIFWPDVICINKEAFRGYKFLKEVDMNKALSLETIGIWVFQYCFF